MGRDPNRTEEEAQGNRMPCLYLVLYPVLKYLPEFDKTLNTSGPTKPSVSPLLTKNRVCEWKLNLAAKRSTANKWIHAEAPVCSFENILVMPGNCRKISLPQ